MADRVIIEKIQVKRGDAASWVSANPVLLDGEIGFERDTNKIKVGNGILPWNNLEYIAGGAGSGSLVSDTSPQLGGNLDLNGNFITGLRLGIDVQPFSAVLANTTASFTSSKDLQLNSLGSRLDSLEAANTGDQDISGIATNAAAIALNTTKVSYPGPQTASQVNVSPAVNSFSNVQAVLTDHESRIVGLAAGGSDGVVSNVVLNGTNLVFTGSGGGFNGTIALSGILGNSSASLATADQTLDGNRTIDLDGNNLTLNGTNGNIFTINQFGKFQVFNNLDIDGAVNVNEYVRYSTGTLNQGWDVGAQPIFPPAGFTTGDLSITYESGNGSGNEAEYIFNRTGVPVNDKDVATKAYVDANITTSTDDQTASEVTITDAGEYFSGTTVELALQELGSFSTSGISTPNQNSIDNSRDFYIQYHTTDQTIDSVGVYITRNGSGDEGKKVINTVEAANDVDYTLTDIGTIGQTVIIDNDGTGTVRLIADSTETFIGSGNTDEDFSNNENMAIIPTFSRVIATKKKTNTWRIDGVYSTLQLLDVLYTTPAPHNPNNESNDVTMWEPGTNGTVTSSSTQADTGTLSSYLQTNGVQRICLPLPNVVTGDDITVTVRVYNEDIRGNSYIWLNPTTPKPSGGSVEWVNADQNNVNYQLLNVTTNGVAWTTYTVTNTAAVDNPSVTFDLGAGLDLYVDNIVVTKNN